jgi:hypothetical protein
MEPAVVASLVGRRQMEFALPCLESLLRRSGDPIRLRIHDDGTLTRNDRALLVDRLQAVVVTREEADAAAVGRLADFPHATAFRAANPLALKLLDVAFLAEGDILYCDADILFLRPFVGLFRAAPEAPAFMRDSQDAYSVRPWHLLRWPRLRLAGKLNSGIIASPRSTWSLEAIEGVLSLPGLRPPVWAEQTCWAYLAGTAQARLLDPEQFAIARPGLPEGETVAIHYVSPVRSLLPDALRRVAAGEFDADRPAVSARTHAAGRCTVASLALAALNRRLARRRR